MEYSREMIRKAMKSMLLKMGLEMVPITSTKIKMGLEIL